MMGEDRLELHGTGNESLSELMRAAGVDLAQPCGGKGRCGKCRVRVSGELSEPSVQERSILSTSELAQGFRLACCAKARGKVCLTIAEKGAAKIRTDGRAQQTEFNPLHHKLGAAVDVGTTTLAAQLLDGEQTLASAAMLNPQRSFGADVISRVGSALEGQADALARNIRGAISTLLCELCAQTGRDTAEIDGIVITGNTVMLYLLTETDVTPLSRAPFEIEEHFGCMLRASELDLPCARDALLYLPRCMSSFVGADITTALLASGICGREQTALLADIGTNGELALWHDGQLTCCSTAAGPAFEGANLSCGMQGGVGAIDHVWTQDASLHFHTLGDVQPKGICGSGVADLLACLLELGVIDETGYFADDADAYPLVEGVFFSQADVRQVQLAKSAVCSGMRTLIDHAGLKVRDVQTLELAGGFGSYLSTDSAAAIGLIPRQLEGKCRVLGNAALAGAVMLLKDVRLQAQSEAMAEKSLTLELASNPVFMEHYIDGMQFCACK